MNNNEDEDFKLPMFHLEEKFPNAQSIFSVFSPTVKEIKDEALFVIDTNVLLIPYEIPPKSLNNIKTTYKTLIKQKRLFIPSQVAREFVKNRGEKIKNLYNSIAQKRNLNLNKTNYRLLENLDKYSELLGIEEDLISKIKDYRTKLNEILNHIRSWHWNDPVSNLYQDLFKSEIIVDYEIEKKELVEDLEKRLSNRIPPGFKDSAKDDKGIGDIIIWNTILELGRKYKKPIIFVTGDEKTDWMLRSNNEALCPNFELIEEYYRASNGNSFQILRFSELLDLFDVNESIVEEVKTEEKKSDLYLNNLRDNLITTKQGTLFDSVVKQSFHKWLLELYPNEEILIEANTLDFFVKCSDGQSIGFEVKATRNLRSFRFKLLDNIARCLNIKENNSIETLVLVFIFTEAVDISEYISLLKNVEMKGINVIVGYLEESRKFQTIYDSFHW